MRYILYRFLILLLFLTSCNNQSEIKWQNIDPNDFLLGGIPLPSEVKGEAADKIADVIAENTRTKEGRQNMMIETLMPYYGILFLIGIISSGACLGMYFLHIPLGRFLWIVPVTAFGGMAFIHFWSDYARWISAIAGGLCLLILAWKLVEWKWERNENYKELERARIN